MSDHENQLKSLHLSLLEDFLPVGMAVFNRFKKGGVEKTFKGLIDSDHRLEKLREEGFQSAKLVRDKLDGLSPGLGNPAFEVKATTSTRQENQQCNSKEDSLSDILKRVNERLELAQSYIDSYHSRSINS